MRSVIFASLLALPGQAALQLCSRASRASLPVSMSAATTSRRQLGQDCALAAFGVLSACSAAPASAAEEFNKMSGVLEPYIDVQKGYKLFKPVAWNQFDTDPGVYDIKFQDLIEPAETVQVSSSPVSTATSVSALGDLETVGGKFAASRGGKLVSSTQRDADGSLVYQFEVQGDAFHEYILLSINRGKLFRLTTTTTNKRWPKRAEMYKNVALSFVPKGF